MSIKMSVFAIQDVENVILYDLSLDDLRQWCRTNQYYHHLCHTDPVIKKRMDTINQKMDIIYKYITTYRLSHILLQPENPTLLFELFRQLMNQFGMNIKGDEFNE